MSIKQDALDHYDRMIEQAEKYDEDIDVSGAKMCADIREDWYAGSCSYCINFSGCHNCKLNKVAYFNNGSCCGGLWHIMTHSNTWKEWIINAKKVKAYIKKHG